MITIVTVIVTVIVIIFNEGTQLAIAVFSGALQNINDQLLEVLASQRKSSFQHYEKHKHPLYTAQLSRDMCMLYLCHVFALSLAGILSHFRIL